MKVPKELKAVDPNATLQKRNYSKRWVATVFGKEFDLGSSAHDVYMAINCSTVIAEMEAIKLNESLGLPWNAKTGLWLALGEIDRNEAERIAGTVKFRHFRTNYDELLESGFSKEDAREWMDVR